MSRRKSIEVAAWLAALLLLGWLLPMLLGVVYTDSLLHLAYAALAILFAAPRVADAVSANPDGLFRHLAGGIGFGLLSFALLMLIDTIRANRAADGQLWPEPAHLARIFAVAAALAAFGSALAAAIALRMRKPGMARRVLRIVFLAMLFASVYGIRALTPDAQFELMSMTQGGAEWGTFATVTGGLLAAAASLAWFAQRSLRLL